MLAHTIKSTTQKHDKMKLLENEKKALEQKLQEAEKSFVDSSELKLHFIEGAMWMRIILVYLLILAR